MFWLNLVFKKKKGKHKVVGAFLNKKSCWQNEKNILILILYYINNEHHYETVVETQLFHSESKIRFYWTFRAQISTGRCVFLSAHPYRVMKISVSLSPSLAQRSIQKLFFRPLLTEKNCLFPTIYTLPLHYGYGRFSNNYSHWDAVHANVFNKNHAVFNLSTRPTENHTRTTLHPFVSPSRMIYRVYRVTTNVTHRGIERVYGYANSG